MNKQKPISRSSSMNESINICQYIWNPIWSLKAVIKTLMHKAQSEARAWTMTQRREKEKAY